MSIIIVRYRGSIETIKTDDPKTEVNRIMKKYTNDILSISVNNTVIYTKK